MIRYDMGPEKNVRFRRVKSAQIWRQGTPEKTTRIVNPEERCADCAHMAKGKTHCRSKMKYSCVYEADV